MTNRDIYEAALSILSEEQDELSEDYEARAPYLLSLLFGECRSLDGVWRRATGEKEADEADTLPDLDDICPLSEEFYSAGAYFLAATLVEVENRELSDRLYARYAAQLSRIARGVGLNEPIRDVYGFGVI